MAKKKQSTSAVSKEKSYYDSLDLQSWWEEFAHESNPNGTAKWKTVWAFIISKTKIQWQRNLLWWMLGPKAESHSVKFTDIPQFDWMEKRERGWWYSSKNTTELQNELNAQQNALLKMSEIGNKINLPIITRIQQFMEQIDKEFSNGILLPNLAAKENHARANLYMSMHTQALKLMQVAQVMYANSLGLDIQRLTDFLGLFSKGMGQVAGLSTHFIGASSPSNNPEADAARDSYKRVVDMVMEKASNFEMPLPDKNMEEIILESRTPQLVKGNK